MFPMDMALNRCASFMCEEGLRAFKEDVRNFFRTSLHISRALGVSEKDERRCSFGVRWEKDGVEEGIVGEDLGENAPT